MPALPSWRWGLDSEVHTNLGAESEGTLTCRAALGPYRGINQDADPSDDGELYVLYVRPGLTDSAENGMAGRQVGVELLWPAANSREPEWLSLAEAVLESSPDRLERSRV